MSHLGNSLRVSTVYTTYSFLQTKADVAPGVIEPLLIRPVAPRTLMTWEGEWLVCGGHPV